MLVRGRMTPSVVTVSPETTLADAAGAVRAHRVRHLPVLQNGRLVGIITDRDLRLAMPPVWANNQAELTEALRQHTVAEIMTGNVITIDADMPLEDAARQMYANRIGCLPVTDGGKLVGMLTKTDLLRTLTELFNAGPASRRIEVEVPDRPGELGHVVRVIGVDHRINIAGMVVPPLARGNGCLAIIHLEVDDASRVVHALRRLGYRCGSPSIDADPDSGAAVPHSAPVHRERALAEL
jgi:acetoin utilization protein AcuB